MNLVEAGEQAGALETLLDKIATYKEKTEALKKKIKKALFYPPPCWPSRSSSLVILIFRDPAVRSAVQGLRRRPAGVHADRHRHVAIFVQDGGCSSARSSAAIYGFIYFKKRSRSMQQLHRPHARSRCRSSGPILHKAAIARYARTLSTMFAAGVPLVEALESVAGAAGNIVYETAMRKMRDEVATGSACSARWRTPACSRTWSSR